MIHKVSNVKRFVPQGAMDFDPQAWRYIKANCYSYVTGLMDLGVSVPGSLCDEFLIKGSEVSPETMRKGILADGFEEIRGHGADPAKRHVIQVFYNAARRDIHPYHLHKDKSWSNLRAMPVQQEHDGFVCHGRENFVTRRHFDGIGLKIRSAGFDAARLGYDVLLGFFAMREDGVDYIPRA